jgi:hypothetical protein
MLPIKRIISNDRVFSNESENEFTSVSQTVYDYGWGKRGERVGKE